jgi:hypothetical protein
LKKRVSIRVGFGAGFIFEEHGMARLAACSTGDLANNLDKLRHELQQSKYVGHVDVRAWRKGNP